MLKLMYITNRPEIAKIAEKSGVEVIFVDLEYIGKAERQGGMDTVQSHHTFSDIINIRQAITTSSLLVRINPIHKETKDYCSSEEEIDKVIKCGADMVMLPYFKTLEEVKLFLKYVDKRAKTMLLVETKEACEILDDILSLDGIDRVHIGLNDLKISYGRKFMFEFLADGTVEKLCKKFHEKNIPYGFGGIASLNNGLVPAQLIIKEHYRLLSDCAILSRSFCNTSKITDLETINKIFTDGLKEIREFEKYCEGNTKQLNENISELKKAIKTVADSIN